MSLNPAALPFLPRLPSTPIHRHHYAATAVYISCYYFHHGFLHQGYLCRPPPPPPPCAVDSTLQESDVKMAAAMKKMKLRRCHGRGHQEEEEVKGIVGGNTTVMIKNIPNRIKREELVHLLEKHCFEDNQNSNGVSAFDFVYLPMDFRSGSNLGYAFVNMTTSEGAERISEGLNNYRWRVHNTKKVCRVMSAKIQGKEALQRHFQNSNFCCDSEDFLPVAYSPPRSGPPPPQAVVVGLDAASTSPSTSASSAAGGATVVGKCVGSSASSSSSATAFVKKKSTNIK